MREITGGTLLSETLEFDLGGCEISYGTPRGELIKMILDEGNAVFCDSGAIAVSTGEFTGRSPKDRYIVRDVLTESRVNWGDVNIPFGQNMFDRLYTKVLDYLAGKKVYVRDSSLCADERYRIPVRTVLENAYQDLFVENMFRATGNSRNGDQGWIIVAAPGFRADPHLDGTRQHNFSIINFSRRMVLIGGTGYTGEIKKAMFSVLNFLLPYKGVLPMHCAANQGKGGDTALFFGLSGTGKTTLSTEPDRNLIGDDEHGWSDHLVFNFEGGCYAKTAGLRPEKEPQIVEAIREGALLENVGFKAGTCMPDFDDIRRTENTRVSYPLEFLRNVVPSSTGRIPGNIFFLSADAFGVLPPISRLTTPQAMYHFLSGYTAKVAGTEFGINEPVATFSACFGKAFLPLHATRYAALLGERLQESGARVWLVNTGWAGGGFGVGERISLANTRALVSAALSGGLDHDDYEEDPIFGLRMPHHAPGVAPELLNPVKAWSDREAYYEQANRLASLFRRNFEQFDGGGEEWISGGPLIRVSAPSMPAPCP